MSDNHETKAEVINKIRKLLRLSKSSNIHEAERAAEMASKLMEKWRVSAASVQEELNDIRTGNEKIVSVGFIVPNCKMKLKWVESLGFACALLFDGTVIVNGHLHGTSWKWVGFEKEIPMMQDLFMHLWDCYPSIAETDLKIAKETHRQRKIVEYDMQDDIGMSTSMFNFTPAETMKFKHGHGQGFTLALVRRCDALALARKRAVEATSTALVLVRDGALTKWKEDNGIRVVKQKQTQGDSRGFNAGFQRGNSIALGGALK